MLGRAALSEARARAHVVKAQLGLGSSLPECFVRPNRRLALEPAPFAPAVSFLTEVSSPSFTGFGQDQNDIASTRAEKFAFFMLTLSLKILKFIVFTMKQSLYHSYHTLIKQ